MTHNAELVQGPWRIVPLEGTFELSYRDETGQPTGRTVVAQELKIGPGKTLLGATDTAIDGYRGFRADRIEELIDHATGEIVRRNVLDWLLKRAVQQARERRRAAPLAA